MDTTKTIPQEEKKSPAKLLNEKKKGFDLRRYGYLLLCMFIPTVLMYLIYLARGIHPFGDESVLVLDLNAQYVWFFEALRSFVRGDASLLYSFSRALGGEFLGIYAYYIASPLSYLTCLFPKDCMLEALLFLFLLKTAICGGTFGYYMHKTSEKRNPFSIVIFATLYALSSYAVVQQHNTMWIDAMMWLPLVTLGIENLIKHGKFKMYTIFLALTLFSNFYIGYMVCIYCALYFFYYYFSNNEENRNNPLKENKHFIKSLIRIAIYSLIAIGMAMVIILSAYYALNFGKTTFSDPDWVLNVKFDLLDLLYKFLPGSFDTVRPEGYPFVYCGLLTLLLLPVYFLSNKNSLRQRIFTGAFILIFAASFSFNIPDLIWHGFQNPNWLNYRYSFMLCFLLCVIACRTFSDFETVPLKTVGVTAAFVGLLCVILQKYSDNAYVNPPDLICIWFTILMLFVYLAVLAVLKKAVDKNVVCIVLVAAISIEAFLNGFWNMNALDRDVVYSTYSSYNDFLNKTRPVVEQVQAQDQSFYRMEKTFSRTTNDNMALGIRGLSGSTSTLNKETIQLLEKMGYSSSSHWSRYLGGTPVNDSLLGLKYIVTAKGGMSVYDNYYTQVTNADGSYVQDENYRAYLNPYALSLAFGVDEDVLSYRMGYTNVEPEKDENAENQETSAIADLIAAMKSQLNVWFDIDETINHSEYVDQYESPFERLNAMITAMLGEEEMVEVFVPIDIHESSYNNNIIKSYTSGHFAYKKKDANAVGYVSYNITMPVDGELYFYMPSDYPREVKLSLLVDEKAPISQGNFHGGDTSRIISLGNRGANSELELRLTLTGNDMYQMTGQDFFYYIDWEVFNDVFSRLSKDEFIINDFTEDSFYGTFTASESHELVMTTLAFDKGWKVYVDGMEVETTKVFGSFVSFYIDGEAGQTHNVEILYRPNTFFIGLTVSLISLALFILVILLEKQLKKNKLLCNVVCVPESEKAENEKTESKEEAKEKDASQEASPPNTDESASESQNDQDETDAVQTEQMTATENEKKDEASDATTNADVTEEAASAKKEAETTPAIQTTEENVEKTENSDHDSIGKDA